MDKDQRKDLLGALMVPFVLLWMALFAASIAWMLNRLFNAVL